MEDVRAALGRRIRDLRKLKGWSQEELAHRAGLHWTYVGQVERGKRNIAIVNIAKLANALNVNLSEMFSAFNQRATTRRGKP